MNSYLVVLNKRVRWVKGRSAQRAARDLVALQAAEAVCICGLWIVQDVPKPRTTVPLVARKNKKNQHTRAAYLGTRCDLHTFNGG
jgi:hypothetical protein